MYTNKKAAAANRPPPSPTKVTLAACSIALYTNPQPSLLSWWGGGSMDLAQLLALDLSVEQVFEAFEANNGVCGLQDLKRVLAVLGIAEAEAEEAHLESLVDDIGGYGGDGGGGAMGLQAYGNLISTLCGAVKRLRTQRNKADTAAGEQQCEDQLMWDALCSEREEAEARGEGPCAAEAAPVRAGDAGSGEDGFTAQHVRQACEQYGLRPFFHPTIARRRLLSPCEVRALVMADADDCASSAGESESRHTASAASSPRRRRISVADAVAAFTQKHSSVAAQKFRNTLATVRSMRSAENSVGAGAAASPGRRSLAAGTLQSMRRGKPAVGFCSTPSSRASSSEAEVLAPLQRAAAHDSKQDGDDTCIDTESVLYSEPADLEAASMVADVWTSGAPAAGEKQHPHQKQQQPQPRRRPSSAPAGGRKPCRRSPRRFRRLGRVPAAVTKPPTVPRSPRFYDGKQRTAERANAPLRELATATHKSSAWLGKMQQWTATGAGSSAARHRGALASRSAWAVPVLRRDVCRASLR